MLTLRAVMAAAGRPVAIEETRKLIEIATHAFARSVAIYQKAEATVHRSQKRTADSRHLLELHGLHGTTRLLCLLIGARIDDGRLPNTVPAIIPGAPGFGGACAACDGDMPATRLMMAIPDGDWDVYVHADCYVIWVAQCRLRAILRPYRVASSP